MVFAPRHRGSIGKKQRAQGRTRALFGQTTNLCAGNTILIPSTARPTNHSTRTNSQYSLAPTGLRPTPLNNDGPRPTGGRGPNTTRRADNSHNSRPRQTLYRGSPPSHRTSTPSSESTRAHQSAQLPQGMPGDPSPVTKLLGPLQNQAPLVPTPLLSSASTPSAPKTRINRNKYKNLSIIRNFNLRYCARKEKKRAACGRTCQTRRLGMWCLFFFFFIFAPAASK